jgi:tripartite ATP-independent transporter DctM subunit
MEWYWSLALIILPFIALLMAGVPVVFSFLAVNGVGMFLLMGGEPGLEQLINTIYRSLNIFVLVPITLFILMGEVLFRSGIAMNMVDTIDKWVGRLPGRLSLVAVGSGTILSALSGSTIGSTAMLTTTLLPEMERRGYHRSMSLGPLMGSGGLSMLIPPSGLGVILAVLAKISVANFLVAIVLPGLLLAAIYVVYVLFRCTLQPHLAPPYAFDPPPLLERILLSIRYILPLTLIIFLVIGLMFLGVATATEAAALGTAGAFILAAAYGKFSWELVWASLISTLRTAVMVLTILAAAEAFSQILAFTGATRHLVAWAAAQPLPPILLILAMLGVLLVLGCFLSGVPMMMITLPIFLPLLAKLGYDPIWFCVLFLLLMEMGQITPPYGILLFVVKSVVPKGTTMSNIIGAAMPFLLCQFVALTLLIAFPAISLWLPSLMRN